MELKEAPFLREDVFFRRIGVDVRIAKSKGGLFWEKVPSHGLAVSKIYGYTFFAHPGGFGVVKTAELCQLALALKENTKTASTVLDKSLVNVVLSGVRSLVLSSNELELAVSVRNSVHLYDVPTLVLKGNANSSKTVFVASETGFVKDFSWSPSKQQAYVALSDQGKLVAGQLGNARTVIEDGALAVSWSPDGDHIAYATRDGYLNITDRDISRTFKFSLPDLSVHDEDVSAQVDTIHWVRPDSIMVSYVRTSEDCESECPLLMVHCTQGTLAQEGVERMPIIFDTLFASIDATVVPPGSGPYMLVEYLPLWDMALAINKRSVDDHIVLLGWQSDEGPVSIDISNDAWVPRIELPEEEGENAVVGLGVDLTAEQIKFADPRDETGVAMLPACPVLLCMTLEGKISLFSFARWGFPELVRTPQEVPSSSNTEASKDDTSKDAEDELQAVSGVIRRKADTMSTESEESTSLSDTEEPIELEVGSDASEETLGQSWNGSVLPSETPRSKTRKELTASVQSPWKADTSEDMRKQAGTISERLKPATEPLGPQSKSIFERFTLDAPQPSDKGYSQKSSSQANVELYSAEHIEEGDPASWGSRSQPSKVERVVKQGFAKSLEGLYRPYSSSTSVSLLAQESQTLQVPPPAKEGFTSPFPLFGHAGPRLQGPSTVKPPSSSVSTLSSRSQPEQTPATLSALNSGKNVDVVLRPSAFQRSSKKHQIEPQIPGVSEMEIEFIKELEKVRQMADQTDALMSYLQSNLVSGKGVPPAAYAEISLEELEKGISNLSENSKRLKKIIDEQQLEVEELADDTMKVDTWRIHAQSLAEQAADTWHWDFWMHQNLHPELETRRNAVVEADQALKQQIDDLERHLQSLEFNHTQHSRGSFRKQFTVNKQSPTQLQAVQNLYSTVNAQMTVAEQLVQCLSQQMRVLNISSTPSRIIPVQPAAAGILKSLGVSVEEDDALQSPSSKPRSNFSQDSGESALATPRQHLPIESDPAQQESTRRRRDSMDMAWVGAGAAKTTIKRSSRVERKTLPGVHQESLRYVRGMKASVDGSPPATTGNQPKQNKAVPGSRVSSLSVSPQPVGGELRKPSAAVDSTANFIRPPASGKPGSNDQSKASVFQWASAVSSQFPSSTLAGPSLSFTSSSSATAHRSSETGTASSNESGTTGLFGTTSRFSMSTKSEQTDASPAIAPFDIHRSVSGPMVAGTSTSTSVTADSERRKTGYRLSFSVSSPNDGITAAPPQREWSVPTFSTTASSLPSKDPVNTTGGSTSISREQLPGMSPFSPVPIISLPGNRASSGSAHQSAGLGVMAANSEASVSPTPSPAVEELSLPPAPEKATPMEPKVPPSLVREVPWVPPAPKEPPRPSSPAVVAAVSRTPSFGSLPASVGGAPSTTSASTAIAAVSLTPSLGSLPASVAGASTTTSASTATAAASLTPSFGSLPASIAGASSTTSTSTAVAAASLTPTFGSLSPSVTNPMSTSVVSSGFAPSFTSRTASSSTPPALFGQPASTQVAAAPQFGFSSPSPAANPSILSFPSLPQALAADSDGEVMEEEVLSTPSAGFGAFGGFGGLALGTPAPPAEKVNPFGVESSPGFGMSVPSGGMSVPGGQLFRPASFSLPPAQSSPQSSASPFGSGFQPASGTAFGQASSSAGSGGGGFGSATAFGQPAQVGQGQHALGSALGTFGQTRQLGSGFGGSGFGSVGAPGFAGAASGSGFASSPGVGFAGAASGGGFAAAASGGGFAAAAAGGGFSGAAAGSGFASALSGGGGFGASGSGGFTGFGGFGGSPGFGAAAQTPLFTQMRK